jgi:hypothetical protein
MTVRVLSNFILFTGAAGLMLLVSLNFYALLEGGPNAVAFFSPEWAATWGGAYAGFAIAMVFGVIGRLSAQQTAR